MPGIGRGDRLGRLGQVFQLPDRRLAARRLTVVDATSVTVAARRPLLRAAASARQPAVGIVFEFPAAIVVGRNAARADRVVPEAIVRRHLAELAASLRSPGLEAEGFAAVVRLDTPAAVDALRLVRVPAR
jgi:protein phosphatase